MTTELELLTEISQTKSAKFTKDQWDHWGPGLSWDEKDQLLRSMIGKGYVSVIAGSWEQKGVGLVSIHLTDQGREAIDQAS